MKSRRCYYQFLGYLYGKMRYCFVECKSAFENLKKYRSLTGLSSIYFLGLAKKTKFPHKMWNTQLWFLNKSPTIINCYYCINANEWSADFYFSYPYWAIKYFLSFLIYIHTHTTWVVFLTIDQEEHILSIFQSSLPYPWRHVLGKSWQT